LYDKLLAPDGARAESGTDGIPRVIRFAHPAALGPGYWGCISQV